MAKKWDELPVYEIGTEKGAKLYDDGMRTNQPQTMSDGAQIYRGNDGNMYANKNGTTMAVKNNYNPFTSGNFKFEYDNGYGKQAQNIAQQLSGMTYDSWKQNSGQYAALANRYAQQGKMAMQDTVGDVSARTGGLASSYATTAGNQAYNQYMQTLEDAAMALYGDEYNRKMQQFNMMQGLDDAAYGRAWDNMNFEYGLYQDEYQRGQDALANARADAQLTGNYNGQRTLAGQEYDRTGTWHDEETTTSKNETDYNRALAISEHTKDFSSMAEFGWTDKQIADANSQANKPATSSGSTKGSTTKKLPGVVGSDAWFQQLYDTYGDDAATMIKYGYSDLGVKAGSVEDLGYAYEEWLNGRENLSNEMQKDHFRATMNSLSARMQAGRTIDVDKEDFSAEQWEALKDLCSRFGYDIEE